MSRTSNKSAFLLGLLSLCWSCWALSQPAPPRKPGKRGTTRNLRKKPRVKPPFHRRFLKRPTIMKRRIKASVWRRCESCHSTSSWKKIKQNSSFDHTSTGFPLHGKHKQARCNRCHGGKAKKPTRGRPSHFVSTGHSIRSCKSCHKSPHQKTVSSNCQSCHNSRSWKQHRLFARHQRTQFPLTGAHASTACKNCHVNKEQQGYRKLSLKCSTCHTKEFVRPTNHPNHVTSGFSRNCQSCHSTYSWRPANINHALFFPLVGAHAATACNKCHVNNRYKGTPKNCMGCHQADYTKAGHTSAHFSSNCLSCHTQTAWRPARFGNHKFPINAGNHSGLKCNQCHTTPKTYRAFSCLAPCHTQAKMDQEHRNENVAGYVYESKKCLSCHPQGD